MPTPALPRVWPVLVASAAAGAFLALGGLHRYQDGDSLIPVLMSLYGWDLFFWEQNRFGMLVPLLATPFTHPLTNLIVQTALTAGSGVAGVFFVARYLFRDGSWAAIGSAAVVSLLLVAPPVFVWMFLSTRLPFAPALPLVIGALLLAVPPADRRWPPVGRLVVAAVCVALAGWVDASAGLFAFPLAVATGVTRWVLDPGPGGRRLRAFVRTPHAREVALAAALTFGGTVFAMALQELSPYQTTTAVFPSPQLWWDNLARAATRFWSELAPREWAVFLAGCLGVVVLIAFRRTRPAVASSLLVAAAVVATTAAYFVFVTVTFDSKWRYAIPAFVAAHVALVGAVVRPLVLAVGERARRAIGWASLAAAVAAGMVFGPPSVGGVRAALDELDGRRTDWQTDPEVPFGRLSTCGWSDRWAGKRADAVVEAGCTHVVGPYWPTVPVVFGASLRLADRGERRVVWGLTPRFEPVAAKWRAVPREQMRVAALGDDREAEQYLGFRFVLAETVGPIRVLVPAP